MTKILFICHGNICRSPMAEYVMKQLVRERGLEDQFRIDSAATSREELLLFTPWLYEEILLTQPERIVTLGNVALQALMGKDAVIGACHGTSMRAEVRHEGRAQQFEVFPLYHPASIIYNRSLIEVYAQDLVALRALLDRDN